AISMPAWAAPRLPPPERTSARVTPPACRAVPPAPRKPSRRLRHQDDEHLDDAGRLLRALELDGDGGGHLIAQGDRGHGLEKHSAAQACADRDGSREPYLVDAVVQRRLEAVDPIDLLSEDRHQ